MFTRKIYPILEKHLISPEVTVITGMRRTGKTTSIKYLMGKITSPNKLYIDLERLDSREIFAQKNYDAVLNSFAQLGIDTKKKIYIFLDEIQLVKNIPSVIKYLVDTYKIKFVVTGSSSYYLKNLFSESLSGRKKIFEIYPLDFSEFLTFKGVKYKDEKFLDKKFNKAEYERLQSYYEEFITYGGFPGVVNTASIADKKDMLFDILDSYIKLDIKALADFRSLDKVDKLLKMLSGRVGTKLDYSKISRLSGLGRETVLNYIDFFENTYLITRVPVLAKNPDREIVKAQKLYFCDNGFMDILSDSNSGTKFENAIFNQLRHFGKLQYFSLKSGREIDFILNGKVGLEAKESPVEQDQTKLNGLCDDAQIAHGRLIGRLAVPKFLDYIWGGEVR